MIDHRRIQRTLLRMQLDPRFAASVFAGEAAALASTGLGARELALVRGADPLGIAADREGARRAQLLRNVTAEFELSVAAAGPRGAAFVAGFAASEELHRAISEGGRLALAFADYARGRARELGDPVVAALVVLEQAMARARRSLRALPALAADEVVLAPHANLCTLPEGTFASATALREAHGASIGGHSVSADDSQTETVLLLSKRTSAHRLREVEAERLEPSVAALLHAAESSFGLEARARWASARDVDAREVEGFVDGLVRDGVLTSARAVSAAGSAAR